MEAAAIPEIKEAIRRVATADCERAAEAALSLDTAEAVEELVAGTFAPSLFDLLTGSEDGSYAEEPITAREAHRTLPDS
jgi:phosphotransferase system enzyme I (PtsI)